ncbi:hypothetical protein D9M70_637790 [compost metagenome]
MPKRPTSSPSRIIATALRTERLARATAAIRPSTSRAKYSAEAMFFANCPSTGANAATTSVPKHPASNEASAAIARAAPPRPFLAI